MDLTKILAGAAFAVGTVMAGADYAAAADKKDVGIVANYVAEHGMSKADMEKVFQIGKFPAGNRFGAFPSQARFLICMEGDDLDTLMISLPEGAYSMKMGSENVPSPKQFIVTGIFGNVNKRVRVDIGADGTLEIASNIGNGGDGVTDEDNKAYTSLMGKSADIIKDPKIAPGYFIGFKELAGAAKDLKPKSP